jgi:8-oxo-dGTP pyrophosphatase MutT (NUDIX family)
VDDKDILMIRVERPVIGDWPLELPAGDSLCGEKPIDAAVREFGEETGIRIENKTRFIPDLDISEMPGRIPVLLSVFTVHITRNEYDLRGKRDPEIHSIELVPIRDAAKRILSGDIYIGVPCAIISRLVFKRMLYETR